MTVLFKKIKEALVSVLPNTMQAVSGMVGFVLLALAMDRLDLKNRLQFQ